MSEAKYNGDNLKNKIEMRATLALNAVAESACKQREGHNGPKSSSRQRVLNKPQWLESPKAEAVYSIRGGGGACHTPPGAARTYESALARQSQRPISARAAPNERDPTPINEGEAPSLYNE